MRIFVAQIDPTVGDLEGNTQKIIKEIQAGKKANADLVLFSELVLSGYPAEDLLLLPHFIKSIEDYLRQIVQATEGIAAIVGLPRFNPKAQEKQLFNSAAIIQNGSLLGFHDKILLPTYDVFDERRYFEPGDVIKLWEIGNQKIGVTICEDIWQHSDFVKSTSYLKDPVVELEKLKPELIVNLSASPFSVYKPSVRYKVCSKAALAAGCPVILCNQVGGNDSLIFDGYSLYVGSDGILRKHLAGFKEDAYCIDLKKDLPPFEFLIDDQSDLFQALVLGLRDYFHKLGFTKACFGLSGGIDSALVACIAVAALGKDNVLAIGMPSRFSSKGSIEDSEILAKNLDIAFQVIPIEEPFQTYLDLLEPHFKGKAFDTTEENLQARIRAMILMAISNKLGYIVLSTGNKSELAMGYSTLYGDMCGGLATISDMTKRQVYALSRWINRNEEIIPQRIIDKPPSAELRANQKDSDSLPDYEIVDNVLQEYVEEHKSAEEIATKHKYPVDLVQNLICRIHRNEYKRRQSPPGLRISEKAFSVGRRFPIVHKWQN